MKKIIKLIKEIGGVIARPVFNFFKERPYRIFIFLVVILAAFLRLYKLGSLPPGASLSEVEVLNKITSLKTSNDFWLGVYFIDGLYLYILALITKIFSTDLLVIRIVSAVIGVLTVWLSYIFSREWFNRETGYFVAFLMAISSWHITLSRNIDPNILLPFVILLLLVLTTYAFRTKRMIYFILSGITFGLGLYVDIAFLFAPLIFIVAGLYFYLRNKKFLTAYLREITIAVNAFILVSIPYFISFFKFKADFLNEIYLRNNPKELLNNLGLSLQTLFSQGESNFFYNLGAEPLLDPFIAVLFLFGIGYSVVYAKRRKNFFLLVLFLVMLLPAIFTKSFVLDKLTGTIPVIFILSGVTLNYLSRHWAKTFPFNKSAKLILVLGITFFLSVSFVYNTQRYFVAWGNSDEVKSIYSNQIVE